MSNSGTPSKVTSFVTSHKNVEDDALDFIDPRTGEKIEIDEEQPLPNSDYSEIYRGCGRGRLIEDFKRQDGDLESQLRMKRPIAFENRAIEIYFGRISQKKQQKSKEKEEESNEEVNTSESTNCVQTEKTDLYD